MDITYVYMYANKRSVGCLTVVLIKANSPPTGFSRKKEKGRKKKM